MIHFVYIVNGTGGDSHTHTAYVSARFLRIQHPEARITCLMDRESAAAIRQCRHPLLSLLDSVVELDVPEPDPNRKNRWISTRMRDLIEGDFLYLDSDTICVSRLDSLFGLLERKSFDVAMVRDLNHRLPCLSRRLGRRSMWGRLHAMGWTPPKQGYFNKGVMLLRDTSIARAMTLKWQDLWKASCATGRYFDQPALNQAIVESGARVNVLSGRYNAQAKYAPTTIFGARILHLFSSAPETFSETVLGDFVAECAVTGSLSDASVRKFLRDPFPWKNRQSFAAYCSECNRFTSATRVAMNRLLRGKPMFHPAFPKIPGNKKAPLDMAMPKGAESRGKPLTHGI